MGTNCVIDLCLFDHGMDFMYLYDNDQADNFSKMISKLDAKKHYGSNNDE